MTANQHTPSSTTTPRTSLQAWVLAIGAAVLPLAVWPALAEPFQTPKRFVLRLMAIGVVACWVANPSRLRQLPRSAALLVMPLLLLVGLGVARGIPGSDAVTLDLLATTVIALAAASIDSRNGKVVCAGLVAGAAILSLVTCLQFLGLDVVAAVGGTVDWRQYADKMRMYGTMGNPNMVGLVAAVGLPLAIGLIVVTGQNRWQRWLSAAAAVAMALAIFVTFSKAAMGASMAGLVILWLLAERRRRWSWTRRGVAAVAMAVVVVAFLLVLPHYSLGQNRPDQTMSRPWSEAASGRLTLWHEGLRAAGQSPLWGLGPTGLSRSFAIEGLRARHVHNDYIEALADGGILLCLWSAVAVGAVVVTGCRRRQTNDVLRPLHITIAMALLVAAAVAVVDFPMQRPAERALVLLLAGLLMSPTGVVTASDPQPVSWRTTIRFALAFALLLFALATESRTVVADRLLWRAEGLEQYGHDRQADDVYHRAARHGADLFRVHQGLGRIALNQGRFREALSHARLAYQLFPDPAPASLFRRVESRLSTSVVYPIDPELTERKP